MVIAVLKGPADLITSISSKFKDERSEEMVTLIDSFYFFKAISTMRHLNIDPLLFLFFFHFFF